jgi:hypothetical protein
MNQAVRTRGSMILTLAVLTALGAIALTAEPVQARFIPPIVVVPRPKPPKKPPHVHRPPPTHNNNGGGGGVPPGGGGGTPPGGQNAPEPATLLTGLIGAGVLGLYASRRKKPAADA